MVILIDKMRKSKVNLVRQHLRSASENKEWFLDGIFVSLEGKVRYEQVLLDFEINKTRDNVYIVDAISTMNPKSKEFESSLRTYTELDIIRIFFPHL